MNDNYWYPREPLPFLTDTLWCDSATEVAHNRLTDTYYALRRPINDDCDELCNIGKIKQADYMRVRGNLERLGWRFEGGVLRHKRIEETMASMEDSRLRRQKQTEAARRAAHGPDSVTPPVTNSVTDSVVGSVTGVQLQVQVQSQKEVTNNTHTHTPEVRVSVGPEEAKTALAKVQFQQANAFEALQADICALYGRPVKVFGINCEEHHLLLEISKRIGVKQELKLIQNYRQRMPAKDKRFFPQSAVRLLQNWDDVLDRARNYQAPGPKDQVSRDTAALARELGVEV